MYLLALAVLGAATYFVYRPTPAVVVAAPEMLVAADPTMETVEFPAPEEIPGDRGDIRVARGPMQVKMSRQLQTSPFRFAEITAEPASTSCISRG